MKIPELVSKHLKLLSQKPATKMTAQEGMVVKQALGLVTLLSRGSPSRVFNPDTEGVKGKE